MATNTDTQTHPTMASTTDQCSLTMVMMMVAADSPDNQFDIVSSMFDDSDGIGMEHTLCRISIDL